MAIRAHITVVLKDGQRYDANHIAVARRWPGNNVFLTFLSSGHTHEVYADDVATIDYPSYTD